MPGWYPGVVIMVVRVTMTMVVRVTVRVTVGVLFPRGMLMGFSTVPVDVNRATHCERKGAPEGALFQVEGIVCLGKLLTLVESFGLQSPCGKPDDQKDYLKVKEIEAGHHLQGRMNLITKRVGAK